MFGGIRGPRETHGSVDLTEENRSSPLKLLRSALRIRSPPRNTPFCYTKPRTSAPAFGSTLLPRALAGPRESPWEMHGSVDLGEEKRSPVVTAVGSLVCAMQFRRHVLQGLILSSRPMSVWHARVGRGGKFGSVVFAAFRGIDAFRSKRSTLRYPVVPAAAGDFQFQDVLHTGTALRSELRSRSLLPKTTHFCTRNFSPLPY